MKSIKLNAFSLFLILLAVLVIFMLLNDWFKEGLMQKELQRDGFIDFEKDRSSLSGVFIPQYNPTSVQIVKLYDNLFFDQTNANLIEVIESGAPTISGNVIATGGNVSAGGNSVGQTKTSIAVITNTSSGNPKNYAPNLDSNGNPIPVPESLNKNPDTKTWRSYTYITQGTNTDTYKVFYLNWENNILISVINLTQKQLVADYVGALPGHVGSTISGLIAIQKSANPNIRFTNTTETPNTVTTINQLVTLSGYGPSDRKVFQLSDYVYYDSVNGNLVLQNPNPSNNTPYQIIDRTGKPLPQYYDTTALIPNNTGNTWEAMDIFGNKLVKYVAIGKYTVILLLSPNINGNSIEIVNLKTFDDKGLYNGTTIQQPPSSSQTQPTTGVSVPVASGVTNNVVAAGWEKIINIYSTNNITANANYTSDWYNNYWGNASNSKAKPDDYILKTQIVPPVCPACPSCSVSNGTCTNCGGQGGSGTLNNSGTSLAKGPNNLQSTENLLYSAGSGATNLVRDAGSGADRFVRDMTAGAVLTGAAAGEATWKAGKEVAQGASNAVGSVYGAGKDVASDVYGVGKDVVGGAYGVGKDVVGGAYGVGKDVVGGAYGLLTSGRPTQINDGSAPNLQTGGYNNSYGGPGQPGMQAPGPNLSNQGQASNMDPYSYYGALSSKKSNFLPVTADFSKFGR